MVMHIQRGDDKWLLLLCDDNGFLRCYDMIWYVVMTSCDMRYVKI